MISGTVADMSCDQYESQLESEVRSADVPNHIAFIMDGNRRYAKEVLGREPVEGHVLGKKKLEEVVHWCLDLGIHYITAYAFSTENFKRDPDEIDFIMNLLKDTLYSFS